MPSMLALQEHHTCRQVAVREGANLTYLYQDHLGSAAVAVDASTNRAQYLQGATTGCADTLNYGARWYDPITGRFLQADTIVPQPGNPQSLNRYAYCLNNPLKYTDPTGHDPMNAGWQKQFIKTHGSLDNTDYVLRLFSLMFPEEYAQAAFYNSAGERDDALVAEVLHPDPNHVARTWADMPAALENLAAHYSPGEEGLYTRNIGTLGGLANRISTPSDFEAITNGGDGGCPVYLGGNGNGYLSEHLTGQTGLGDKDYNFHHWAFGVAMGEAWGRGPGIFLNIIRETYQYLNGNPLSDILSYDKDRPFPAFRNYYGDWRIGNLGARFGHDLYNEGFGRCDPGEAFEDTMR